MKELLTELIRNDIHVKLVDNEISLKVPPKGIAPDLLAEIKSRKGDLIEYLKGLQVDAFELSLIHI